MQIIPTILEKDFDRAREKILVVKDLVKWIQLDVVDGFFTFGKTFELELVNKVEGIENLLLETHLMVKEPINWIEKSIFINASRIIGHVEMMSDREKFVKKVKDKGVEVGLAIDVETDTGEIPEETDLVLLMGRKAGFENYPFKEVIYERIRQLVKIRAKNKLDFKIGIDGGVNKNNINKLEKAGAEIAYCGGAIFNGMVKDNLEKLNYVSKN